MSDVFSLFEEEAANPQAFEISKDKTKNLSSLIRLSIDVEKQIKETEDYLKDLKQKKRTVDEEDIPSLMEELESHK